MKASKRLKQAMADIEAGRCIVTGVDAAKMLFARVTPAQPSALANKRAAARILAKFHDEAPWEPRLLSSGPRPPGCKRRGGKWVPR